MTRFEFAVLAYELIGNRTDVAFRARPGPRTIKRLKNCTVIRVDLKSPTCEADMREGLELVPVPLIEGAV